MNFKHILLGTAAAVSIAALAQNNAAQAHNHGWYVGIEGGANWVNKGQATVAGDVDFLKSDNDNTTLNQHEKYNTGWAVIGTVGYAFWESNWRLEGELGYRSNTARLSFTDPFAGGANEGDDGMPTRARLTEFSLMANALYDIPVTDRLSFSIGAGVGGENARLTEGPFADSSWSFAYQGIAGLNYAITKRLDLFVDFRYFRATNPNFSTGLGFEAVAINHNDFEKETVTVGLRWDLTPDEEPMAAAPPPPPPPPPPPAPREFIVFFGFNKSNLTAEAHHVVQEAAAAAKQYGTATILITGHTDTVGSNKYNMRLSIRRATVTKAGLVAEGIAPGSISTNGKGETELLVQTADGVKEPQNRRATIDLN